MNIQTVIETLSELINTAKTVNFLIGQTSVLLNDLHATGRELTAEEIAGIVQIRSRSEQSLANAIAENK